MFGSEKDTDHKTTCVIQNKKNYGREIAELKQILPKYESSFVKSFALLVPENIQIMLKTTQMI
jgi:hypothetical protein